MDWLLLGLIVTGLANALGIYIACGLIWFVERRIREDLHRLGQVEELDVEVKGLKHRARMLQGRLNTIAPPREGTGAPEAAGDVVTPEVSALPRSRNDLLLAARRRLG